MGREDATRRRTPHEVAEGSALASLCRPVIEAAPLPMAAVEGPQHVVRAMNSAFCRLIGVAPAAVIGRPFAVAIPAWAGSSALFDRVARTGKAEAAVDQPQARPGTGGWSCLVWPVPASGERPASCSWCRRRRTPTSSASN